jgi:hypothetical protein
LANAKKQNKTKSQQKNKTKRNKNKTKTGQQQNETYKRNDMMRCNFRRRTTALNLPNDAKSEAGKRHQYDNNSHLWVRSNKVNEFD